MTWEFKKKKIILVGVAALFWAIWLCRNDLVFKKTETISFLQALFRGTYWLRFWRLLQKEETREDIKLVCQNLEVVAMELFAKKGWRFNHRLCAG